MDNDEMQSNELMDPINIGEENVNEVIQAEGKGAVESDELLTKKDTYADSVASVTPDDTENSEPEKSEGRKLFEDILDWFKSICIGLIVGVLVVVFVIQRSDVYGQSMEKTLFSGDVILAEKISTYFKSFDRGDIVILDGKDMEGYDREEYLVKRVIGLPGETIKIEDGNVYIKQVGSDEFMLLEEPYLEPGTVTNVQQFGIERGYDCYTLADDEYFCMGDNRGVSNDSRRLGPFTAKRIKGVAVVRVYPFSTFKVL